MYCIKNILILQLNTDMTKCVAGENHMFRQTVEIGLCNWSLHILVHRLIATFKKRC